MVAGSGALRQQAGRSAAQEASTAERAYTAPPGAGEDRGRSFLARAGDWLSDGEVTVEDTATADYSGLDNWTQIWWDTDATGPSRLKSSTPAPSSSPRSP